MNISKIISVQAIRRIFLLKASAVTALKKHDQPHTLQIALCILSGEVRSGCCSCIAGKVGFCNHVLALMFKLCKFLLFNCSTTKDLSEEDDEHVPLACTSHLQQRHKKGGGGNIAPQPVIVVQENKIKDDDATPWSGLNTGRSYKRQDTPPWSTLLASCAMVESQNNGRIT